MQTVTTFPPVVALPPTSTLVVSSWTRAFPFPMPAGPVMDTLSLHDALPILAETVKPSPWYWTSLAPAAVVDPGGSEEHTAELQARPQVVWGEEVEGEGSEVVDTARE